MHHILNHIISRIKGTEINTQPYPHFFVENIFPENFYAEILTNLPKQKIYTPVDNFGNVVERRSANRSVLNLQPQEIALLESKQEKFWAEVANILQSNDFASAIIDYLFSHIKLRLIGEKVINVHSSTMLCNLKQGYSLGPHSDSPHKLITILFYLPKDNKNTELGTSIYTPRDIQFECTGGPHYRFSDFELLKTAPFIPNSLFGFVKTDNSFHGVKKIEVAGADRNTLALNLTF